MTLIYKICNIELWEKRKLKATTGAEIDLRDGFIHFSTAEQLANASPAF